MGGKVIRVVDVFCFCLLKFCQRKKKKNFANSGNENLDRTPPCNLKHKLLCTTVIYLFFKQNKKNNFRRPDQRVPKELLGEGFALPNVVMRGKMW